MEEQFPVPRNHAASKIGNGVISLLWQLRWHCNPDHNKISSSSNTTVVSVFPNLCLWRRSLRSNVGGIDPEKLYRATLSYARAIRVISFNPSFLILIYCCNFLWVCKTVMLFFGALYARFINKRDACSYFQCSKITRGQKQFKSEE